MHLHLKRDSNYGGSELEAQICLVIVWVIFVVTFNRKEKESSRRLDAYYIFFSKYSSICEEYHFCFVCSVFFSEIFSIR